MIQIAFITIYHSTAQWEPLSVRGTRKHTGPETPFCAWQATRFALQKRESGKMGKRKSGKTGQRYMCTVK